ncbi:Cytochrome P450 [Paracoccus aminovorans]|uniref:Cytochrome P450 n=1 Tax=Paracoccus aminovorans TaxID=34004 RepID=A0A1I3B306_9RHOB|nr:cytochrome P450 [Paracoccus aminovorans]CQR87576.1 Cytochrome P450 [Paracoccus aminovorans]SFH56687.1 Cytochrome P450 [Paracoccus aminovorans]
MTETSLLSKAARACPYHTYRQLRATAPVRFMADQDIWVLSRYEDCDYVLSNPERFSSRESLSSKNAYRNCSAALDVLSNSRAQPRQRTLILADGESHKRHRKAIQNALSPARMLRDFGPTIEGRVNSFIDAFVEDGRCDAVSQFAIPLPMSLVARIFDTPEEMIPTLKGWSDNFFAALSGLMPDEVVVRAARDTLEFEHFILDRVAVRRGKDGTDFLSRLTNGVDGAEPLNDAEIVNICSQILVGGNESTISMLGNLIHQLATTEGLQEELRADPDRIPAFVEECLRHEPPLQAMYRISLHEETLGGQVIPAGAKLMLNFGSANRDEKFYADGESFDLDRDNTETLHLTFGRGRHACVGQTIARREGVVAVSALLDRLDNIRLDPALPPVRAKIFGVRGFEGLPITFDPRG